MIHYKVKLKESEKRDSYNNYNNNENWWCYLPTPPLGQDMTQGQFFLSGV